MSDTEYVNEEYGVPAYKDGMPQDPRNHNGPKADDTNGLTSVQIQNGEAEDRVAKAKAEEDEERETPEKPKVASRAKVAEKETR